VQVHPYDCAFCIMGTATSIERLSKAPWWQSRLVCLKERPLAIQDRCHEAKSNALRGVLLGERRPRKIHYIQFVGAVS
jgi:hypothetical protein